ncbi:LOW QUALITY PROTEIN: uncharacterized protein [Centruroides vittatus]|uniref:LOW QUALITY PROTEIN: uncharacterized protein n=1 Tax=Centruroides vittatus TaxID=120091 RepID=UPI0035105968
MGVDDNQMKESKHRLKQRFVVLRKLGHGTYGKVQLAVNKDTGQEVAIKTIKKAKIENEQDLVRIRREIQIMSYVQHPHIIHIHEVFENKEKIVLVMQYASGGEMYDYLKSRKSLPEAEARRIFRQIVSAVYYCHKNRICHRDLKLENILLDEKGNAKIADFGLSNIFSENNFLHTFCGSPLYASPEIVRGKPYYGPEVDCWSLGVLLYTFIYGAMPFDGSNFRGLVKQISEGDYYEPKKKSDASGLIRDLLTVQPTKRATILDTCNHWWVNLGYEHSLLQVAEDMANFSPVNMDALLNVPHLKTSEENKSVTRKIPNNLKLCCSNQNNAIEGEKDGKNETLPNKNKAERSGNLVNSNSISCSDDSLMLNDLESPADNVITPNEGSRSSADKSFLFSGSNVKKQVGKTTENNLTVIRKSKETSINSVQDNLTQNKPIVTDTINRRRRINAESSLNENASNKNDSTKDDVISYESKEVVTTFCIKLRPRKPSLDYKTPEKSEQTDAKNKENNELQELPTASENNKEQTRDVNECVTILLDNKNVKDVTKECDNSKSLEVKAESTTDSKNESNDVKNKEKSNSSENERSSDSIKTEDSVENNISQKKNFIQNAVEKMEGEISQDSKTKDSEDSKKASAKKGPGKLVIPKFFESSQSTKGADTKKVNIPSWAVSDVKKTFETKTQEKKPVFIPTRRVSDARSKFEQKIESNAYTTLPRRASKQGAGLKEEINEQRRRSDTNDCISKETEETKSDVQENSENGIKKTSNSENDDDIKAESNRNTCIENQENSTVILKNENLETSNLNPNLSSESLKKENRSSKLTAESVVSENSSATQDQKFDNVSNEHDDDKLSSDVKKTPNDPFLPISSPILEAPSSTSEFDSNIPNTNSEKTNTSDKILDTNCNGDREKSTKGDDDKVKTNKFVSDITSENNCNDKEKAKIDVELNSMAETASVEEIKHEKSLELTSLAQKQITSKESHLVESKIESKSASHSKRRNSDFSSLSHSSDKYNTLGLRDIHDLPESCYNDMLQFLHSRSPSRNRYSTSFVSRQKQTKHSLNTDHQNRIRNWLKSEQVNGHSTDKDSSDNDEDFDIHFDYNYPSSTNSNVSSGARKIEDNSVNPVNKYPKTMRSISQIDYNSVDVAPKEYNSTNSLSNEEMITRSKLVTEIRNSLEETATLQFIKIRHLNTSWLYLQNSAFKPPSLYGIQDNDQSNRMTNAAELYGTWQRRPSCHSSHKMVQQQRDRLYASSLINEPRNMSNFMPPTSTRDIYGTIRRSKHNYGRSLSVDIPQNPTIYEPKIQNYSQQENECRNINLENKYSAYLNNYDKSKMSNGKTSRENQELENSSIKFQNNERRSCNPSDANNNNDDDEDKLKTGQDLDNLKKEAAHKCQPQVAGSFQPQTNDNKLPTLSLLDALKLKGYRNLIAQQNTYNVKPNFIAEESGLLENYNYRYKTTNQLEHLTEDEKVREEAAPVSHPDLQPLAEADNNAKEKLMPVCETNELSVCKIDSDQEESVSERIWRKSFYSRFNDSRMKKRKAYREGDPKAQSLSASNWNVLIEENLRDDLTRPRRSSLTVGNNHWSSLPRPTTKPLVKHHSYEGPDPVLQLGDLLGNSTKHRCQKMSKRSSSLGMVEDVSDANTCSVVPYPNATQQPHHSILLDYNLPYSAPVASNINKLYGTIRALPTYKEDYLSEENFKTRISSQGKLSPRRFSALDGYLFASKSPSLSDSIASLNDSDKPENEEIS